MLNGKTKRLLRNVLFFSIILAISSLIIAQLLQRSQRLSRQEFTKNIPSSSDVHYQDYQEEFDVTLNWMDRSDADKFNDYGDGTCLPNKDRDNFILLMKKWLTVSKESKIEYFLTFGTLLGAWRNTDVIPWAGHLDIYINVDNFVSILNMSSVNKPINPEDEKFHVLVNPDWRKPYKDKKYYNCQRKAVNIQKKDICSFKDPFARFLIGEDYVDIFVYAIDETEKVKLEPLNGNLDIHTLFPLTRCMFMGLEMRCPANARFLLNKQFDGVLEPQEKCRDGVYISKTK